MPTRITTWNLQGRARPDLSAVAEVLRELGSDAVLLQEVQRSQARRIAGELGWEGVVWRFKHWPVVIPAEGLAVLFPAPITVADAVVLARRWAFWSSHRRIALAVDVPADHGLLRLVDTHLGAGVADTERARQATLVADLSRSGRRSVPSVIGGDLNTHPGSMVIDTLAVHGHRDAWSTVHGDDPGPTNWKAGPRNGAPVQRLDYLLVDPALESVDVTVPTHGDPGFERFGSLSDHLPVTATINHP